MSEHSLPPDRSSWPTNPYLLLGVRPGVSPRDLRKAYLHLVRSYKPEHAPEEFQRIRGAYEQLREIAEFSRSPEPDDWPGPVDATPAGPGSAQPGGGQGPRPPGDPWARAILGEVEEAYRELAGGTDGGSAREEVYLQLYWLLDSSPQLDPDRPPCDWLVRGLLDRGTRVARLRTLLTREATFDPALAVGERLTPLLSPGAPTGLLADVAGCRWRAARWLGRWKVIPVDLDSLHGWVPMADADAWSRLLIDAAMNMAWAPEEKQWLFDGLKREAEEFAGQDLALIDDLSQIEYAERAASGLRRLRPKHAFASGLHDLLRLTWDQPAPVARPRLLAHFAEVAADPAGWFRRLDLVGAEASAALDMLMKLPDQLGVAGRSRLEPADLPDVSAAVVEFLAPRRWWNYPSLRPHLLMFCLSEMVSPDVVALVARGRPELRLPDAQHLADVVSADWPLASVYRGCAIVRD